MIPFQERKDILCTVEQSPKFNRQLLQMRDNLCHYARIIDTYAPCVVGVSRWNNNVNMDAYCATSDRKLWNDKILVSISDEAFILVCLINYGKRWYAQDIKAERKVRNNVLSNIITNNVLTIPHHYTEK